MVLTKNPNKYYPRLELHVIHKDLVKQAHKYLISLGMKGHVYKCRGKNKNSKWKTFQQYRFQFNGKNNLLLFNNLIGFVNPKQEYKFKIFMNYHEEYERSMKGIASKNQFPIRKKINSGFIKEMAMPGIEPGTSSS